MIKTGLVMNIISILMISFMFIFWIKFFLIRNVLSCNFSRFGIIKKIWWRIKFWERICKSLEKEHLNCYLEFFFRKKKNESYLISL